MLKFNFNQKLYTSYLGRNEYKLEIYGVNSLPTSVEDFS
jgi:hypothetical protein